MVPAADGHKANSTAVVAMDGVEFRWPGQAGFGLTIDRFEIEKGETVMLLGQSGSGKSTLLSLIAGIVSPSRGRLAILGTDIVGLSSAGRDRFRAEHCGIIFQMFNLLPYGSVLDNVLLPLSFGRKRRARVEARGPVRDEARRLLSSLGLESAGMEDQRAARLSVGQQQRVAAARALIGQPELIIADEPTSALDSDRQQAFLDLLFAEVAAAGSTLIMVSHEERFAPLFSRVLRLDEITSAGRAAA